MPDTSDSSAHEIEELRRRLELLEDQNERLRDQLGPMIGPDNPLFNPRKFQKAMTRLGMMVVPIYVLMVMLAPLSMLGSRFLPTMRIGPLPLVDCVGIKTRHPGLGLGVFAFGGGALGVVAFGGLAVGVIAMGGGAVGLIALGGGSFGIIAYGGGAVGWIAVGGGAVGRYVLAQRGYGKYVLAINRQDDEAAAFFSRWVPGIRAAVTRPMPVILISQASPAEKTI